MTQKILFIEDDSTLGELYSDVLQKGGFEVTYRNTLKNIRQVIADLMPDLLILDLEVGNDNSLDEIPFIHRKHPSIPIIVATSHIDSLTVDRCYEGGAAQVIKKMYGINELLHHIYHLLPPNLPTTAANGITFGQYLLNTDTHTLSFLNIWSATLNPKEFQLLHLLLENKETIVSRTHILQQVWNNEAADSSLNNYITRLRHYLSKDPNIQIQTIKKEGYTLTL